MHDVFDVVDDVSDLEDWPGTGTAMLASLEEVTVPASAIGNVTMSGPSFFAKLAASHSSRASTIVPSEAAGSSTANPSSMAQRNVANTTSTTSGRSIPIPLSTPITLSRSASRTASGTSSALPAPSRLRSSSGVDPQTAPTSVAPSSAAVASVSQAPKTPIKTDLWLDTPDHAVSETVIFVLTSIRLTDTYRIRS